jgi:anti-sigma regulatory factor (Ser/Thr protein kinase)
MGQHEIEPYQSVATLLVPDTLKQGTLGVESLYNLLVQLPPARRYVFDMKHVTFIEPCGVIALVSSARHCSEISGRRVLINNMSDPVYSYLKRMNVFDVANRWLAPIGKVKEEWNRSEDTVNLLELTPITSPEDVAEVAERSERIFAPYLMHSDLHSMLTVLSELCSNVYEHSQDPHGCVLIQKYYSEQQNRVVVCLSVGDSGCGVMANLIQRHSYLGDEPLDFIRAAMNGQSSRRTGRGGFGLRTVRQITAEYGGYVTLRSDTGAVTDWGKSGGVQSMRSLARVAGAQVSVRMHAVLPN